MGIQSDVLINFILNNLNESGYEYAKHRPDKHGYVGAPIEQIAFVQTCQEKRGKQLIKKNDGRGRTGEEKKGATQTEMDGQQPRRYDKIRTDS